MVGVGEGRVREKPDHVIRNTFSRQEANHNVLAYNVSIVFYFVLQYERF